MLQDLLAGVRDRVVVAVTFLAMLELMKRREIVVTQDEPWGPIVARATTAEERGGGGACRTRRSTRAWSRSRDRGAGRSAGARRRRRPIWTSIRRPVAEQLTEAQLEALLFVAERPLTRREIATLAGVDRATVDERLGDLEVALADRGIRLVAVGRPGRARRRRRTPAP